MNQLPSSVIARFNNGVLRTSNPSDCWTWQRAKTRAGYGVLGTGHAHLLYAHRVAYELAHGTIEGKQEVCHSCDNPSCCNPHHLFLGSHVENVADMVRKGRNSPPPRSKGLRNVNAKLSDDIVRDMRLMRAAGMRYADIAAKFGVGHWTVGRVIRGESWQHVK